MARYALVNKETGKVENVIEWDGKSDISWLLSVEDVVYDVVPAHDPSNPNIYIGDIGDYYDRNRKEYLRPVAIKVGGKVVFKGKVRLREVRDIIAKRTAGRAPTDVVEILYWEEAEKEEAELVVPI